MNNAESIFRIFKYGHYRHFAKIQRLPMCSTVAFKKGSSVFQNFATIFCTTPFPAVKKTVTRMIKVSKKYHGRGVWKMGMGGKWDGGLIF